MIEINQSCNLESKFTDFILGIKSNKNDWFQLEIFTDIYGDNMCEISFENKKIELENGTIEELKNGINYSLGIK